jgi:hypothetical protein
MVEYSLIFTRLVTPSFHLLFTDLADCVTYIHVDLYYSLLHLLYQ